MHARLDSSHENNSGETYLLENLYSLYFFLSEPNPSLRVLKNSFLEFLKKCLNSGDNIIANSPVFLKVVARRLEFLAETGFFADKMAIALLQVIIDDLRNDGIILQSLLTDENDVDAFFDNIAMIDRSTAPSHSVSIHAPSKINTEVSYTCRSEIRIARAIPVVEILPMPAMDYLAELIDKGLDAMFALHWERAITYFEEGLSAIRSLNPVNIAPLNMKAAAIRRHLSVAYHSIGQTHQHNHNLDAAIQNYLHSHEALKGIAENCLLTDDHFTIELYKADYIKTINLYYEELKSEKEHRKILLILVKATRQINLKIYIDNPDEVALLENLIQTVMSYTKQLMSAQKYEQTISILQYAILNNTALAGHTSAETRKNCKMTLRKMLVKNYYFLGRKYLTDNPQISVISFCFALTESYQIDQSLLSETHKQFQQAIADIIVASFKVNELEEAKQHLGNFRITAPSREVRVLIMNTMINISIKQSALYKKQNNFDKALEKLYSTLYMLERIDVIAKASHQEAIINRMIADVTYLAIQQVNHNHVKCLQYCVKGIAALTSITGDLRIEYDNIILKALRMAHGTQLQAYLKACRTYEDYDIFIRTIASQLPTPDELIGACYVRCFVYASLIQAQACLGKHNFTKALQILVQAEKLWKQTPHSTFMQVDLVTSANINRLMAQALLAQFRVMHTTVFADNLVAKIDILLKASLRYEEICDIHLTEEDKSSRQVIYAVLEKLQIQIEDKLCSSIEMLCKLHNESDDNHPIEPWEHYFDAHMAAKIIEMNEDMSNENQIKVVLLSKSFLDSYVNYPYKSQMKLCLNYIEHNLILSRHLEAHANLQSAANLSLSF